MEDDVEEILQNTSYGKQKWYVIFNGPYKGIYHDWAIASSHIVGKSVSHKSYPTREAAEQAFRESYKTVATEDIQRSQRFVSLNQRLQEQTAKLNAANKIKNILTTKEKEEMKRPTVEKFQRSWDSLINYNEVHTTMFFYPKRRRAGPRAIFLPGASPMDVHDYFIHGLIDTIYINGENLREIQELPLKAQSIIKGYNDFFAKGRELYLKMTSSHPIFDKEFNLLVPSITIAQLGISNGEYPTRDELEHSTPTIDHLVTALAGVYFGSTKLGVEPGQQDKIRINYCTNNLLIYSHFSEKINEAQQKIIAGFEEQFESFSGQLSLLPEDFKILLCKHLSRVPRHHCEHCTSDTEMME